MCAISLVHPLGHPYVEDGCVTLDEQLRRVQRSAKIIDADCVAKRGTHTRLLEFSNSLKVNGIETGYKHLRCLNDPSRKCKIILLLSIDIRHMFTFISSPLSEFGHVTLQPIANQFIHPTDSLDESESELWTDLTVISLDGYFSFLSCDGQPIKINKFEKFQIYVDDDGRVAWYD